ncbi:MAG TPA: hypothetical protein VNC78_08245 [Actinomycetota bacterium]|nr:hypothetical protein [Actinomycetota bacterium]
MAIATVGLGLVYGFGRAAVGVVMGATILYLGISYFRSAGASLPDPDDLDVADEGLRYVCSMCGLELKIEVLTTDRPPTHCREAMELVGGRIPRPPLKPVE